MMSFNYFLVILICSSDCRNGVGVNSLHVSKDHKFATNPSNGECIDHIITILKKWNWKNVFILTDKNEFQLFQRFSAYGIQPRINVINQSSNYSLSLKHYKNIPRFPNEYFLIWCETVCLDVVHQMVYENKFFRKYDWLFYECPSRKLHLKKKYLSDYVTSGINVYGTTFYPDTLHCSVRRFTYNFMKKKVKSNRKQFLCDEEFPMKPKKSNERKSLMGVNLTLAFIVVPNVTISYLDATGETRYYDLEYEIMMQLSDYLGFRANFMPVPMVFGRQNNTGHWNGILGIVQRKETDGTASTILLTYERGKSFSYTPYVLTTRISIIILDPALDKGNDIDFWTYTKPFSFGVWFCIAAVLCFAGVCFKITDLLYIYSGKHIEKFKPNELMTSSLSSAHSSKNIIIIIVSFQLICLMSAYNANLIASLVTVSSYDPYESVEDLLKNGYKLMVLNNSGQQKIITTAPLSPFPLIKKMFKNDPSLAVESIDHALRRLYSKEKIGFFMRSTVSQSILKTNPGLHIIKKSYFPISLHLFFPNDSSYSAMFSNYIPLIRESGVLEKMIKKYYGEPKEIHTSSMEVSMKNVFSLFLFLAIGIISSILVLFIELTFWKTRETIRLCNIK